MSEITYDQSLNAHYGRADLGTIVLSSLRSAGKDLHALTPGDLTPVDHFYALGVKKSGVVGIQCEGLPARGNGTLLFAFRPEELLRLVEGCGLGGQ